MAAAQTLLTSSLVDSPASSTGLVAPRISRLRRMGSLWHLASFDAPTVAVVWCLAFAWVARVHLPIWLLVVLGLSTWAFYVADRLFDVRRSLNGPRSRFDGAARSVAALEPGHSRSDLHPRHHFHWQHRRIFVPIAVAAAAIALTLVLFWMPWAARARNSVLVAAALVYFTSVHSPKLSAMPRFRLPKELLVGILFTLACAAPAWTRMAANRIQMIPLVLSYMALAWLNCHAIETWESTAGAATDAVSGAGSASILSPALALAAIACIAAALTALEHQPRMTALLAAASISAALLALLDRGRFRMSPTALRSAADLVLLTPLALLAFG